MYLMILSIDSERLLSDSVFLSQTQTKHSTQMHQTSRQQRHFTDSSHVLGRREGTGSAVQLDNYNKLDKDSSPHTHTHTGSLVKRKDTCTHHCVMVTGLRVVLLKASARDGWVIGQSPNNKQPCCRSQWSSGSTLACGARGPRFESCCRQKFLHFHRKSLWYAALGTGCTLTAVSRSTQPSTLRGTVNEYQPYHWVIIPVAMGECSAYSSLQADSKVKFAAWPTSWRPPGADRLSLGGPKWTFACGFAPKAITL